MEQKSFPLIASLILQLDHSSKELLYHLSYGGVIFLVSSSSFIRVGTANSLRHFFSCFLLVMVSLAEVSPFLNSTSAVT